MPRVTLKNRLAQKKFPVTDTGALAEPEAALDVAMKAYASATIVGLGPAVAVAMLGFTTACEGCSGVAPDAAWAWTGSRRKTAPPHHLRDLAVYSRERSITPSRCARFSATNHSQKPEEW